MRALLAWQWDGYPRYHANRANLLLHLFVVPVFLIGTVLVILGALSAAPMRAIGGVVLMAVSVFLQGRGHRLEAARPEPFTSLGNAVARLFLEQWITFPRFVLSGGWARAYSTGSTSAPAHSE